MKRLIRAQDTSLTPQEWLTMLFDKIGTPPKQPNESPNTRKWLFKYDDIRPESMRLDKWYHFLRDQFNQLSEEEVKAIFDKKFPSEKDNVLKIEVLVTSIIVTLKEITINPSKQPSFLPKFFK